MDSEEILNYFVADKITLKLCSRENMLNFLSNLYIYYGQDYTNFLNQYSHFSKEGNEFFTNRLFAWSREAKEVIFRPPNKQENRMWKNIDKNMFSKKALINNSIVKTRNGRDYLVNLDCNVLIGTNSYIEIEKYNDNLLFDFCSDLDIMRIYSNKAMAINQIFNKNKMDLIWKRK